MFFQGLTGYGSPTHTGSSRSPPSTSIFMKAWNRLSGFLIPMLLTSISAVQTFCVVSVGRRYGEMD